MEITEVTEKIKRKQTTKISLKGALPEMKITPLFITPIAFLLAGLLLSGCEDKFNPVSDSWRSWQNGDTVPGYVLSEPSGSRADVRAKAQMWDNYYALELACPLNTGHPDDHVFLPGSELVFALYISNDSDSIWNGQHVIHLVWANTDYENADTVSVYDLVANGRAAPTIDGDGSDEAWSAGIPETQLAIASILGDNGLREAYLMAAYDSSHIYFKLAWPDPNSTMDMGKDLWHFDGRLSWTRKGEEDMAVFYFPTDQPPTGWESLGGATIDLMEMHPADGSLNVWEWMAGRTNPLGYADDLLATASELAGDAGTAVAEPNYDSAKSYPPYVQNPAVEPSAGAQALLESEAIPFEDTLRP
jgi:hypothetical protein